MSIARSILLFFSTYFLSFLLFYLTGFLYWPLLSSVGMGEISFLIVILD